eukprot:15041-Pelagococcus_subviridis.AAC.1
MFSERFASMRETTFGLFGSSSFFFALASSSANMDSSWDRSMLPSVAVSHTVPRTECGWSLSQCNIFTFLTAFATFAAAATDAMPTFAPPGGGGGGGGGPLPPGGGGGGGGAP